MRAIVFDLDGTLYDREAAFAQAFLDYFPDAPRELIHRAALCCDARSVFSLREAEAGRMTVEEMHIHRFKVGMADAEVEITAEAALDFQKLYAEKQAALRVSERMAALINFCRGRCKVAILTNGMEAHQQQKIERLGLSKLVEPGYTFISGALGVSKPAPKIFALAAERLSEQPENILMIGDCYETDIEGALNVGWQAIWFNRENEPVPPTHPAPQHSVRTEEELDELLRRIVG